jgi:hypothetical protein
MQVPAPPDFAAQAPYACLSSGLDQKPQTTLNNGTFGTLAARAHRLSHQVIVNINIRPHRWSPYV